MKRTTIIIIVIIVLVIVLLLVNWKTLFAKKSKTAVTVTKDIGAKQTDGTYKGITATSGLNASLVLQQGSNGPEVKELQHLINAAYPTYGLTEDGIFGTDTYNALFNTYGSITINLLQAWAFYTNNSAADTTAGITNLNWLMNYGK